MSEFLIIGFLLWIIIGSLVWIVSSALKSAAKRSIKKKVTKNVDIHIDALVRKRAQTLKTDDYGNILSQKWLKEVQYFILNVITPDLNQRERGVLAEQENTMRVISIIEEKVSAAYFEKSRDIKFNESMSGREFEYFCANELKKVGWKADVTKGSGEQGVDIVAEKNNVRIVFQCKKYNTPVGNKAVQEIVAGKSHEIADVGCVVSNSSYTKSAKELAMTTGVYLLHYLDLKDIDKIIRGNPN